MFNTLLFLEGSRGLGETLCSPFLPGDHSPAHTRACTHARAPRLPLSTLSPLVHSTGWSWEFLGCNAQASPVVGWETEQPEEKGRQAVVVASWLWMPETRAVPSGPHRLGLYPGESKCSLDVRHLSAHLPNSCSRIISPSTTQCDPYNHTGERATVITLK